MATLAWSLLKPATAQQSLHSCSGQISFRFNLGISIIGDIADVVNTQQLIKLFLF